MADKKSTDRSADRKRLNKSEPYEVAYAKSDRASPARKALLAKGAGGSAKRASTSSAKRSSTSSPKRASTPAKKSAAKTSSSRSTASGSRARQSSSASGSKAAKSSAPAMKRSNAQPQRTPVGRTSSRATPTPPKEEKTPENTAPKTLREADAVDLLTDDHLQVGALFKQYEKLAKKQAPAGQRKTLAQTICDMLKAHTTIEEEIFYPAARRAGLDADLLDEADIEHASAKELIAQIEAGNADDDHYDARVTVLGEYINHHVVEEHTEMFPKCRRAAMDLVALRGEMESRKLALVPEGSEAAAAANGDDGRAGKPPGILAKMGVSLFEKS